MATNALSAGYFWNLIGAALAQGSTLVLNLMLARLLDVEGFGAFSAVQISVLILASVSQVSAWMTAAHFVARYRDSDPSRLGTILFALRAAVAVCAGSVATALFLFSDQYAGDILQQPLVSPALAAASSFVLFTALNNYQIGVLVGFEQLASYAKSSALQSLLVVALTVYAGVLHGAIGASVGLAISSALRCVMTGRVLNQVLRDNRVVVRAGNIKGVLPEVMRFSLPASVNGLTYMGALWFVISTIVQSRDGLILSAVYAACMNIKTLVLFVPVHANGVAVAYLTRVRTTDISRYKSTFSRNLILVAVVTAIPAVIVAAFAGDALSIYGEQFRFAEQFLMLLMGSAIIEALGYALTQHFSSSGRLWSVFFFGSLPRDATMIGGVLYFLPRFGLLSVGWFFVLSWLVYVVGLLFAVFLYWRESNPDRLSVA